MPKRTQPLGGNGDTKSKRSAGASDNGGSFGGVSGGGRLRGTPDLGACGERQPEPGQGDRDTRIGPVRLANAIVLFSCAGELAFFLFFLSPGLGLGPVPGLGVLVQGFVPLSRVLHIYSYL